MDWLMVMLIALAGSGIVTMLLMYAPQTALIFRLPFVPLIVYVLLAVAIGYIAYSTMGWF